MAALLFRTDIPVLILYDFNPSWTSEEQRAVLADVEKMRSSLVALGHPVILIAVESADIAAWMGDVDRTSVVIFNWCEELPGVSRGDVLAARFLERKGYVFTGASSAVLDLSWDKARVKRILDEQCIPTPRWKLFYSPRGCSNWQSFPAIVKPARQHCSVGVDRGSVVENRCELEHRVSFIIETYRQPAIVEEFISGRELHVTIWGNGRLELLPPVEMDYSELPDIHEHICSWDAKFTPGSEPFEKIGLKIPASLNRLERSALESVCFATFRAIGCRDYARLDVRERDGVFFVLDVNPNPDVTSEASAALAAESIGISYGEMISRIVNFSALRFRGVSGYRRRDPVRIKQLSLFG